MGDWPKSATGYTHQRRASRHGSQQLGGAGKLKYLQLSFLVDALRAGTVRAPQLSNEMMR